MFFFGIEAGGRGCVLRRRKTKREERREITVLLIGIVVE
jgi:hypothetical protein